MSSRPLSYRRQTETLPIFLFVDALGLLWTAWWRLAYYPPAEHPRLSSAKRVQIGFVVSASVPTKAVRWASLLRIRQAWGLVIAKFLSDAGWYFLPFRPMKQMREVLKGASRPAGQEFLGFARWPQ